MRRYHACLWAVLTLSIVSGCAAERLEAGGELEDDEDLGAAWPGGAQTINPVPYIDAPPTYQAVFDVTPPAGTPPLALTPTKIRAKTIDLIERADHGAFIRASMFMLFGYCDSGLTPGDLNAPCDNDLLLNALEDAIENRGVHFWLVFEGPGGNSDASDTARTLRFVDALKARLVDTSSGARFHVQGCIAGCILDAGHNNHNKFWIFSSVGGKPVVLQTSENFTYGQYRIHQQAVVVTGDVTLYYGYLRYFNHQLCNAVRWYAGHAGFDDFFADNCEAEWQPESVYAHRVRVSGTTVAHFMPVRNGDDPVVQALDRIDTSKPCKIHVAMSLWTNARESYAAPGIVAKLKSLSTKCSVKVIVDPDSNISRSGFGNRVTVTERHLHSKYMLIDATMRSRAGAMVPTKLVASGSATFAGTIRVSDDTWLEIENASLYAAFLSNWHTILYVPPPVPAVVDFVKHGNNGTVSCNTFCEGAVWGEVGGCVGAVRSDIDQRTTCSTVPGLLSAGQLTCECVRGFQKHGNNGTVSCNTYCGSSQWAGGTGRCVGAVRSNDGQRLACGEVPGFLGGHELTCQCVP